MDPMGRSFARRAASSGGMPIGSQVDGNCDAIWFVSAALSITSMGPLTWVKARDGAELKVALQPADRRRGRGTAFRHQAGLVTAMPRADGSQSALEVHIFPEAMRGTGEGHYPNRRAQ